MANEDEFSYFQLGTGLPLDGATVRVVPEGTAFVVDNSYAAGATILNLAMQPIDFESGTDSGDQQAQKYSVGKNFEPRERGMEVGHISGKPVKINNQSIYGLFINALMTMEGAAEFMAVARERGLEPNSATLYHDLVFTLGGIEYKDMSGKDKTGIVPVAFHGVWQGAGSAPATPAAAPKPAGPAPTKAAGPAKAAAAPVKAAAKAAAPAAGRAVPPRPSAPAPTAAAPAAAEVQEFSDVIDGIDQAWTDWAIGLAGTHTEYTAFADEAMATDGVAGQAALEAAIMSQKPGSLWAKHHG